MITKVNGYSISCEIGSCLPSYISQGLVMQRCASLPLLCNNSQVPFGNVVDVPLSVTLQVLIEDFAAHGGHKFLFDYLLYLERKGDDDAREAVRNMVFLISGLVTAGFHPGNEGEGRSLE